MPFFGGLFKKPIAERVGLSESVGRDLIAWASLDDQAACQFLVAHLGLIRPEAVAALSLMAEEMSASPKTQTFAADTRRKREILQAILNLGPTRESVYAVYIEFMNRQQRHPW